METDIISDELIEMKTAFPKSFRIVNEAGKGFSHKADAFLYEHNYNGFNSKFYASMYPACFLSANVYENKEFQYSIMTWSGEWKENLNMLEDVLKKISLVGLERVKPEIDGNRLGISYHKPFVELE